MATGIVGNWQTVGREQRLQINTDDIVGEGGFGKVFSGAVDGIPAAVKRMTTNVSPYWELQILMECKHANIVSFFYWDMDNQFIYIAMERCHCNLQQHLIRVENRDIFHNASIMEQATDGLCYLHSCGIIHRDIKLNNILVLNRPIEPLIKLTDFGISKILRRVTSSPEVAGTSGYSVQNLRPPNNCTTQHPQRATSTTTAIAGTPGYLAWEVFLLGSRIRPNVDVFSLGVVFYKILVGVYSHPFGDTDAIGHNNIQWGMKPVLSEIVTKLFPRASGFGELIQRMLEHNNRVRFESQQVSEEIRKLRSFAMTDMAQYSQ